MAKIAILLDAESAALAPRERLVVPEAARVEADVSADRSHVAQHRRCNGGRSLGKHWIVLLQKTRSFNCAQSGQSADFDASIGLWRDPAQRSNPA